MKEELGTKPVKEQQLHACVNERRLVTHIKIFRLGVSLHCTVYIIEQ